MLSTTIFAPAGSELIITSYLEPLMIEAQLVNVNINNSVMIFILFSFLIFGSS